MIPRSSIPFSLHRLLTLCEQKFVRHGNVQLQSAQLNLLNVKKKLLIDISVIYRRDAGTGIQRLVRGVLRQLEMEPLIEYEVRLVAATRWRRYHYVDFEDNKNALRTDAKISPQPGDIFLGLDFSPYTVHKHRRQLAQWRNKGVALHFIVYDILPLQHPEWFSPKQASAFRIWIKVLSALADNFACISHSVEADLMNWFKDHFEFQLGRIPTHVVPMGCDILATKPSYGFPENFSESISKIRKHKAALMVGTIEPRKGHSEILTAFEQIWLSDNDYTLVIVGRPGWKTEELQTRLNQHPEKNNRLIWFNNASDEALLAIYDACRGVIVASFAEGFGLPLIEAIGNGKPVLARDLLVFRNHNADGVDYFSTQGDDCLPVTIKKWLEKTSKEPISNIPRGDMPLWRDTVAALISGFNAIEQRRMADAQRPSEILLRRI